MLFFFVLCDDFKKYLLGRKDYYKIDEKISIYKYLKSEYYVYKGFMFL